MAARAAGAEVMGVLLDGLPEEERTDIINAADKSGLTPVFLAFQRSVRHSGLWCALACTHGAVAGRVGAAQHGADQIAQCHVRTVVGPPRAHVGAPGKGLSFLAASSRAVGNS